MEVDRNLIIQCKKYDKNSMTNLFRYYEKYLYYICYSYTQSQQDALDLMQEIYIKVFKNIKYFDEKLPFHPWIRKISINTCLNFKRGVKNNVISLEKDISEEMTVSDVLVSKENVEDEVMKLEIKQVIKQNLGDIPEKYRIIILLRYYEDLNYNEIAEVLNKPLGTVKTELYRAKALLKQKLKFILEE